MSYPSEEWRSTTQAIRFRRLIERDAHDRWDSRWMWDGEIHTVLVWTIDPHLIETNYNSRVTVRVGEPTQIEGFELHYRRPVVDSMDARTTESTLDTLLDAFTTIFERTFGFEPTYPDNRWDVDFVWATHNPDATTFGEGLKIRYKHRVNNGPAHPLDLNDFISFHREANEFVRRYYNFTEKRPRQLHTANRDVQDALKWGQI